MMIDVRRSQDARVNTLLSEQQIIEFFFVGAKDHFFPVKLVVANSVQYLIWSK